MACLTVMIYSSHVGSGWGRRSWVWPFPLVCQEICAVPLDVDDAKTMHRPNCNIANDEEEGGESECKRSRLNILYKIVFSCFSLPIDNESYTTIRIWWFVGGSNIQTAKGIN